MASGSVRLGQSVAAALRRPEASQDRTYGSGFHVCSGGPTRVRSPAVRGPGLLTSGYLTEELKNSYHR